MNAQDAELIRQDETERWQILMAGHGEIITEEDLNKWKERKMEHTLRFSPDKHQYFINDRPVPSVTQVVRAILGDAIWNATDPWYLERGTAVHACAALIAQGKQFEHDPAIDGQVRACRKFFADWKPEVLEIERQLYGERYQFAGTMDMLCRLNQRSDVIVDWKSALSEVAEIQIGGYGVMCPQARYGIVVALQDDGNYKCGEMFKLDRRKNEFLALRSSYSIKQRLGLKLETPGMINERMERQLLWLNQRIREIAIECNCRAEHGAAGAEHLAEIEELLKHAVKQTEAA